MKSPRRPNILLYCTDQQRFDTIGALGNPFVQTPTLDSLVRSGTTFTRTYCQSPICTPSRSSFFTGLYPSKVHNCRNGNGTFANHPPLISRMIADAGYDTGLIGKFHLQSAGYRTEPRLDDGYRFWKFSHAPRDDWPHGEHDYADWVRARGGDLNALRESPSRVPVELHQTTWATDRAIEFLSQPRTSPWFLTINVYDPHPPFIPPRDYAERFDPECLPGPHVQPGDRRTQHKLARVDFQPQYRNPSPKQGREIQALYYAMIALIDDQLARLLSCLEARGERENCVVIFTSDHGEALGDHGLVQKGCRFYEGLTRVPLIFSGPNIRPGQQADGLTELLDLSATLLETAGMAIPDYHQGRSLWPILRGEESPNSGRPFVRCEYYDALAPEFCGGAGSFATMYRDERYKICSYHDVGQGELYDLHNDPWEHNDLWDSPAHQSLKLELLEANFNATMMASVDVGSERIAPM